MGNKKKGNQPPKEDNQKPQAQPSQQQRNQQQRAQNQPRQDQPQKKQQQKPGDWACPKCHYSNYRQNVECKRCAEPKNVADTSKEAQEQGAPGPSKSSAGPQSIHRRDAPFTQQAPQQQGLQRQVMGQQGPPQWGEPQQRLPLHQQVMGQQQMGFPPGFATKSVPRQHAHNQPQSAPPHGFQAHFPQQGSVPRQAFGGQQQRGPQQNVPVEPVPEPSVVSQPSGSFQQGPSATQKAEKGNKKSGDWACDKCGQKNFAKKVQCKKCSEPRKIEEVKEPSPSSSQASREPSQDPQQLSSAMKQIKLSTKSSGFIESSPDGRVYEGKRGTKCVVEVNYATIKLNNSLKACYHYDITFNPDTPKKMLSIALKEFMRKHFPGYAYGFDGRKNIYTAKELVVNNTKIEASFTGKNIEAHLLDRKKEFEITVQYAATIDMSVLLGYQNPIYQNEDKPSAALQALDIILRSAFRRNIDDGSAIQSNRAIYFVPERQMPLGDGMEMWYGLFQSAILGRKMLYLNTDVLHKAFPSALPLLEYLRTFDRDRRIPNLLNDMQKNKLREFLAMLTIGYRINEREPLKTFGFNNIHVEASRATFLYQGQNMTVQAYFERIKKIKLNFPNLPVLWVGNRMKPENERTYLPIEFCEIPPGQATNKKCTPDCVRTLIKYSATSTDDRKRKIRELLQKISYDTDPSIKGFGISIDKNFQKTDARVIDPPKIKYRNEMLVEPQRGVWRDETCFFLEVDNRSTIKWCILNCDDRTDIISLDNFKRDMVREAQRQNIPLENISTNEIKKFDFRNRNAKLEYDLDNMKKNGYQLVVVCVNDFNNAYAQVKQAAELKVGILTQCVKSKTMGRMNGQIVKNILLKLNAKLNGKNHEVKEISYNTINTPDSGVMFVGADVTHPSPDQKNIPSVVGVASSYDQFGFRYCCAWRMQINLDGKKSQAEEMIKDLENIMLEHLMFYKNANKKLPRKILYYRDGVSDGQFKTVLQEEMTAIRNAMRQAYGPSIPHAEVTFIVVQKRHHTRFFPTNKQFSDGKNNNILPGTVVDKDIVHPFQYQFFLASHAAIQGVTKPTKYCILVNESNIAADDLQAITYDLCHLFTRCNRSVSYPAPTYYAHLVAARGKNYILGSNLRMNTERDLQKEYDMRKLNENFVRTTPMFFV